MTVSDKYSLAVLIIFITISIPTAFVTYKHGTRGWALLGWGYLLVFCSLKIIGSGLALSDTPSSGASIVSSIGLSPLLLALSGVLHEAKFYHADPEKRNANRRTDLLFVLKYHTFTMLGVVLVAVGMSRIMGNASQETVSKGWTIAIVGAVILFLSWVILLAAAGFSVFLGGLSSDGRSKQQRAATMLLVAVLAALPFVGVRVIATLAYLATKNSSIGAATGSVVAKVWLYLFEELAATLILVINGILTMNISKLSNNADGGSYERQQMDVEQPFERK
ncbi:integral membrane protein [Colletotrichum karsti]|uniref:Integral membrane protein n=1 Tax=Colletotrichum karsti TaxID=1095194 RepID=A0A9P6I743_9PEZI|nr:uncharacterized protein CkaCkLH20_04165 [Colletotrichum karsti]KAF9878127.1 integral membrane protein [Colletotrichum karsti]